MVKIAILTLEYTPFKGGVAHYISGLTKELKKHQIDITVIGPDSGCDIKMELLSKKYWPAWLWTFRKIRKQVKKISPDYILVSHVLPLGYITLLCKKIFDIAYIVIVHGRDIEEPKGYKKRLMHLILSHAHMVICNSKYTKSKLPKNIQKTLVIYPGVENIPEQCSSLQSNVILTVGRIVKRKGFEDVIAIMPEIHKIHPNAELHIVGTGPELDHLKNISQNKPYIKIHGKLSPAQLIDAYTKARLFAMPTKNLSGDVEGFGIVYLEAASYGLPCIASNQGGASEAVEHQKTGIVIDSLNNEKLTESIITLLKDDSLAHMLGKAGRERVQKKFVWPITAQPLVQYLQKNRPLISIVIPAYNHNKELKRCLTSIQNQTYKNIEIIIVDDGSDVPVPKIEGTTVLRQINSGAPSARNKGAQLARGEFILFCDADIVMKKNMLALMTETLIRHPNKSFCYSAFKFGMKKFHAIPYSYDFLKKQNYIHTTSLIRKKDWTQFDETLKRFQDWDLWLTMAQSGKEGMHLNKILFNISTKNGKISSYIPSILYRFKFLDVVKKHDKAKQIITDKHGL